MSMLDHGLHKLLEDSIHVSTLPGPDSLQKTNMASVRSKDQSHIRVLLSSFYWDSLRNRTELCVWGGGVGWGKEVGEKERERERSLTFLISNQ